MRLELGKRADYSIRAVLHLARHWGEPGRQKAKAISEAVSIPAAYLPQVLTTLVKEGIVSSDPGPNGGYVLAREPAKITLLQVVEASEGPIASTECVLRGGVCMRDNRCAVHDSWYGAQQALRDRLNRNNFAQLAAIESELARATVVTPAR